MNHEKHSKIDAIIKHYDQVVPFEGALRDWGPHPQAQQVYYSVETTVKTPASNVPPQYSWRISNFQRALIASTTRKQKAYIFRWRCSCGLKVRVQNHALYMVVFAKGAVALVTPMPSENDAATLLQRRGMIPPRRLGEAQII